MAEFAEYHEKPYDMNGYLLLANAAIKLAYEDYVEALKRMWSLNRPDRNQSTMKKFERIMADTLIRSKKCSNLKEAYSKLYLFKKEDLPFHISVSEYNVLTIEKWFLSDHFLLFSRGIDGQIFIDRAKKDVEKWLTDKKHRAGGKNMVISKSVRGEK